MILSNTPKRTRAGQKADVTVINTDTYSLQQNDYILHVTYTVTAPVIITIPSAQVIQGRSFIIKDAAGNAGTNNITIETEGAEMIDGNSNLIIDGDYNSPTLYSDGVNLFII